MSREPGLSIWIRLLRKRYRFLFGVAFLSGVVTLIVVFLVPKWYSARAAILPPHEDTPNFRALNQVTAALQIDRFLPFSERVTLSDVYLAILDSDTVARTLIDRFDLQDYYKQKTLVKTMAQLRKRARVMPTRKRIIEVTVEDKDPERAAELANAYIEELDRVFRETRSTAGKRQRVFLEKRCQEEWAVLDTLETELAAMQTGNAVTVLGGGLGEAATAAGELLGRRMALVVQLDVLTEAGVTAGPIRKRVELEIDALNREIARLPELGLDIARKIRDLKMHEFLYEELVKQLEAAKIEEARNTPAVEVLDVAVPPDRHTRPRRGLASIAGAMAGFALAFFWTAYREQEA